eukprot:TRINITY_DN15280_c0_g3_i3.p2 TRINITY_DN15280_c0_g3~~TRINITY_DN15280_c0_g3_i3.p2  ORF type:complete len:192 (-),score=72.12 TRINITY_DN15280_c0_g3_i3:53-628(-)
MELGKMAATGGKNDLGSPIFYLLLFCMSVSLYFQIFLLNKGLERGDALFIVPVYQVAWVFMNTILGMIYFRDYWAMTNIELILFCLGVVITLSGIYLLSLRTRELAPNDRVILGGSTNDDDDAAVEEVPEHSEVVEAKTTDEATSLLAADKGSVPVQVHQHYHVHIYGNPPNELVNPVGSPVPPAPLAFHQ